MMTADGDPNEVTTEVRDGSPNVPGEIEQEKPVWQTALEISLDRGFVSAYDLLRVHAALAKNRADKTVRKLLEDALRTFQNRNGQIEEFYISPGERWAVIRTVKRVPRRLPLARTSSVDTVFDIEAANYTVRPYGVWRPA